MNILGVTLARGGSKGIKKKNIRLINHKPLIQYTIDEAKDSKLIDTYIVSTDCEEIAEISRNLGADVPFIRPNKYASDTASSVSALQHAVNFLEKERKIKFDIIVELMCTNPLKISKDIDLAIEKLISTNADSVIAVHQLDDHHPARIKKIIDDKIIDFVVEEPNEARRQDLRPKAFIRSGSIYCMKRNYLMEQNKRYGGGNSRPYILPTERAVNVDSEIDFLIAEFMISKKDKA